MITNSCSLGCSSAISNDVQSIRVVLLQSKVNSMQTEVMHYLIQNLKLPEIIIEFPRVGLTSDAGWFVPLWGSSDFFSNRAGFREEVHGIQLASKVSRPPDKHDWFFSFWDGILLINSYHMRCEHEKTFTGIHVFLLVHFCFETASVCIELISVCVESTYDVYQNWLPFVSKQLRIETSVLLKSVPDCIAHTMRCTLG